MNLPKVTKNETYKLVAQKIKEMGEDEVFNSAGIAEKINKPVSRVRTSLQFLRKMGVIKRASSDVIDEWEKV